MTTATKVGDVFRIPVNPDSVGYGQVAAKVRPNPPLIAVFEKLHSREEVPAIDQILAGPILFLVNSFDVKLSSGEWQVIGNRAPDDRIVFPCFKSAIGEANNFYVISYDGKRRRPATPEEAQWLPHRMSVSPVLLEQALRAYHNLDVWMPEFDAIKYETVAASARVSP